MKLYRNFFVLIVAMILTSCASVRNEYSLPTQDLLKHPDGEKTKVVFYNGNGFNPLYLDGSWRVGIKIDGVGVENLHIGKYVQLFLTPGNYSLELSHIDVFTFRDEYSFDVGSETMYVKTYNTPISTKYQIQEKEPQGFADNYEPAVIWGFETIVLPSDEKK